MIKLIKPYLRFIVLFLIAALPAYGDESGVGASQEKKGLYGFGVLQSEDVPLMQAVKSGDLAEVKKLIGTGADVNVKLFNGFTPLHMAASENQAEIANLLIEAGADVNTSMMNGLTPLSIAAERGYVDVIKALLANNAKVDYPPVAMAVTNGNLELVKLLLESGAPVTIKSENGATLLHAAAFAGKTDMIEWLIEKGVDVNAVDSNGRTPLDIALGDEKVESVLKKHGAKSEGGADFEVLSQAAGIAMEKKDYELAKSRYIEALKALKPDNKIYKPARLLTLYYLAGAYYATGDINNAGKTASEFIKDYSDDSRIGKSNLAEMHEMAAKSALASGDLAGVEANLRDATKYYQDGRLNNPVRASVTSKALGDILMRQTRIAEAQVAYTQAYDILKSANNPDPLKLAELQILMGTAMEIQGNRSEAEKVFLDSLEATKQVLGDDNPALLRPMSWLATVSEEQGDNKKAIMWYEKMLAFEGRPGTERIPWPRLRNKYEALKSGAMDPAKNAE